MTENEENEQTRQVLEVLSTRAKNTLKIELMDLGRAYFAGETKTQDQVNEVMDELGKCYLGVVLVTAANMYCALTNKAGAAEMLRAIAMVFDDPQPPT